MWKTIARRKEEYFTLKREENKDFVEAIYNKIAEEGCRFLKKTDDEDK
jgi:hypothetical protein